MPEVTLSFKLSGVHCVVNAEYSRDVEYLLKKVVESVHNVFVFNANGDGCPMTRTEAFEEAVNVKPE